MAIFETLDVHLKEITKTPQRPAQKGGCIIPLLLLSAFAGKFRSTADWTGGQMSLSRMGMQKDIVTTTESPRYQIGSSWELEEMTALVSVTSSCSSAPWRIDPANKPSGFCMSYGAMWTRSCCVEHCYDSTQQALVNEVVLRNRPK